MGRGRHAARPAKSRCLPAQIRRRRRPMFYQPALGDHGLRHDPFKALVVPRPIGWISSLDAEGRPNLAPYSFFNAMATDPPVVVFGTSPRPRSPARKDSQTNIEATGEFVVNLATAALKEQMNASSA